MTKILASDSSNEIIANAIKVGVGTFFLGFFDHDPLSFKNNTLRMSELNWKEKIS